MDNSMQQIMDLLGGFAQEMLQADIDAAKADLAAQKAQLVRKQKQQKIIAKMLATYTAQQKKQEAEWEKQRKANAKKFAKGYGGAAFPGMGTPIVVPAQERRAG